MKLAHRRLVFACSAAVPVLGAIAFNFLPDHVTNVPKKTDPAREAQKRSIEEMLRDIKVKSTEDKLVAVNDGARKTHEIGFPKK